MTGNKNKKKEKISNITKKYYSKRKSKTKEHEEIYLHIKKKTLYQILGVIIFALFIYCIQYILLNINDIKLQMCTMGILILPWLMIGCFASASDEK